MSVLLQAIAIIAPGLAILLGWRNFLVQFGRHRSVFALAMAVTIVIALPPIQDLFHWPGRPDGNTYLLPIFPIIYVLFSRYELPSHSFVFGGTYVTSLGGDLASATKLAFVDDFGIKAFSWIGGAGLLDGLILMPVLATMFSWFLERRLIRGDRIRFLVGHNAYQDERRRAGREDVQAD